MTLMAATWPIAVRMIDLAEPLVPLDDVAGYPRVRVFVRDGLDLIGSFDMWTARQRVSAGRLRETIAQELAEPLVGRALQRTLRVASDAEPSLNATTSVSIVVPTCNRPRDLRRCLTSLSAQRTARAVEVVVVDNRPGTGETRSIVREFPHVICVEEPRAGLSYARNAGFAIAAGDILVAVDDDVVAPPDWIEKLIAPFARPDVMAVTGNVLPLALETEAQWRFEAYGGLGKGFQRREFGGDWFRSARSAVQTWNIGATANAAFRATLFEDGAIGLLDEALGAGTPTGCSEDTYLFYRILQRSHVIVYEPSAWVWHRHRESMESLRQQIYAYSKGHVSYHITTLLRDGDRRALVRLGLTLPLQYLRRLLERARGNSEYPARLIGVEIAGNLAGPWALWQSRRRVRRLGPSAKYVPRAQRIRAADGAAGGVGDTVSSTEPTHVL